MNGNAMYEVAMQRIADQQRAARQAGEARQAREARQTRAAARGRHARKEAPETVVTPVIPDFVEEMFDAAQDAVSGPRQEGSGGRRARTSR